MTVLKDVAGHAVERALRAGATAADVLIREHDTFSATVRMGEVETLKEAITRTLLLRVFIGRRTATSTTSDLSSALVDRLVDETVEMARLTSEDLSGGLPEPDVFQSTFPNLDLIDRTWERLSPEERIGMARQAEAAALAGGPEIVNSEGASFEYAKSRTVLANTLGFNGEYEGTTGALSVAPVARSEEGMQRDFWVSAARHFPALESPESIGRKAAERTLRRIGARKVATCEAPVVFDPLTARTLVGHILQAVSGDSIYRRASFLFDQLGRAVASDAVTIVDDGRMMRGLGSSPFDDEGVPTQVTPIVKAGVLQNYLHSAYSARKLGAHPTGNGARAASGSVTVGPTNFYLQPGKISAGEIIGSVKNGLYVVELIGSGVNAVSGDYSRGAAGLWIEDGRLTFPVHEVTIAGNLRQMLKDIQLVGDDVVFIDSVAAPTVMIGKMVISGD